jgi:uncharacterized membrane protein
VGTGAIATAGTQSGLAENVAGLLCYVLGWVTGVIFFIIDKRPSVRFHAAQSIVVFGAMHIASILLRAIFGLGFTLGGWTGFSLGSMLAGIVNLVCLVLWIVLMVKAYQGQRFEVPIAADIAKSLAGR